MTETIDTRGAKQLAGALEDYAMTDDAWSPTLKSAATELRNLHAANIFTSDLCTQALGEVKRLTSALAAAEARNATLTDDAARVERNRDMWKDQCEAQAATLATVTLLVQHLVDGITQLLVAGPLDAEQRKAFKDARAFLSGATKETDHV